MKLFQFVAHHYKEQETGNIAIDGYFTEDTDADGVTVAWVSPDGEVTLGVHSEPRYLECENIKKAMEATLQAQASSKATLVDNLINDHLDHPSKLHNVLLSIPMQVLSSLLAEYRKC